ncbi:MAG: NAD-dependent epimerase/dehydratase family protein [Streptomycetales bacterium]
MTNYRMTAAVAGGAGFIGSHLVDYLLAGGHRVVVIDDFSTGSRANLAASLGHPRLNLVEGSVLDEDAVEDVVARCDTVFHLAAAVGVHTILERTAESLRTNLHGTETVLRAAARHGCRFLFSSTSEIYGKNVADGLREDDDRIMGSTLTSRWSYAAAKAIDELLTYCYWRDQGLPAVIVRLFNVVGPRQTGRYGMVLPRFVDQVLSGRPLTVYGDGTQTRCFCAVTDIVPALVALVETQRAAGQVVNLGGTEEVAISDLAERVSSIVGARGSVVHVPYEMAYGPGYEDMQRRVPDISRARDLVGFEPTTGLDEVIRAMVASRSRPAQLASATVPVGEVLGAG